MKSNQVSLKRHWPALLDSLALLLVVAVVFWKLALTNLIIARGDVLTYFYPYLDYAAQATRQGQLPLWNPYLFMGAPFLANSQAGFFYPLNRLLSWLPVARAVNVTIVLHAWLAGLGVYVFARRSLKLARAAAWSAGAAFAAGGYLAAQVEHVNQLQGLAWLPWLFVWFDCLVVNEPHLQRRWLGWAGLAVTTALQLLAGHTQSAFISMVGLGFYALLTCPLGPRRAWMGQWAALAGALALGVGLAAAQLVPTLELMQVSIRSGGLSWREAVSFSLKPALLGRALLPGYGQALFSEYVAYLGVSGLALLVIGLMSGASRARVRALIALMGLGLFFALGGYNPLYMLLVQFAPGFALFRAPARWLALYAFGASLLIGVGVDAWPSLPRQLARNVLLAWGALAGVLIVLSFYAARSLVPGVEQPAGALSAASGIGWLVAAGLAVALLLARPRWGGHALTALMLVELFAASASLPFNRATAPESLTSLRPSILNLKLLTANSLAGGNARFLSLFGVFFDPGDRAELASAFADQLSAEAFYDLLVAAKQKEIIAPNLALYYRLPTVDGYDGGVLPLRDYVTFQQLLAPPEQVKLDGRLRETLRDAPDSRWLALMNARYIITDKTLDAWIEDVFYDLQFSTALGAGGAEGASAARAPRFEATALGLVSYLQGAAQLPQGAPVAQVRVGFEDGMTQTFTVRAGIDTAEGVYAKSAAHQPARVGGHFVRDHPEINDYITRLRWDAARVATAISVEPILEAGQIIIRGASLVDERTGAFQPLVISRGGQFALVHSGDVKIYENLEVLPRAFVVPRVRSEQGGQALKAMLDPAFAPAREAVIDAALPAGPACNGCVYTTTLVAYQPERVVVDVQASGHGWLVLTDAFYPGWRARVDGQPAPIARADILFRAVAVPPGQHRVEFIYDPLSFRIGAGISLAALALLCLAPVCCQLTRAMVQSGKPSEEVTREHF